MTITVVATAAMDKLSSPTQLSGNGGGVGCKASFPVACKIQPSPEKLPLVGTVRSSMIPITLRDVNPIDFNVYGTDMWNHRLRHNGYPFNSRNSANV